MNIELKDRNGKDIVIGSTIRDDAGVYVVTLGNFDREDGDEIVAEGDNGIRKLLWTERATKFELVEPQK